MEKRERKKNAGKFPSCRNWEFFHSFEVCEKFRFRFQSPSIIPSLLFEGAERERAISRKLEGLEVCLQLQRKGSGRKAEDEFKNSLGQ